MQVYIHLFAALRERAGASEVSLELPEGSRVGDALARLRGLTRDLPVVMAVNQEYAGEEVELHAGDELALIPPVSGGASVQAAHARVTTEPLSLDALLELVRDPRAGAVVTFLGVTRKVSHLDYQAYVEMAERKIGDIVSAAHRRHGLCAAAAAHRVGVVPLSEPSVAVVASAPHREEAFKGAREIIEQIKAEVPIWKKEEGEWATGARPGQRP